jgi:serine/threonine protein kinase
MVDFNLTVFGWDGLSIPSNLKQICKQLPKWTQLKFLRDACIVGEHQLHFPHAYFHDASGTPFMPAFEKVELINDNGGYAEIYKARRSIYAPEGSIYGSVRLNRVKEFEDICIKEIVLSASEDADENLKEINAILYEAYLHALLYRSLEHAGLQSIVPKIYEIVATSTTGAPAVSPAEIASIWINMELLEGTTLDKWLQVKFRNTTRSANSALLRKILIQLATILDHLQSTLEFNHRDLKVNNVFVRHHATPWSRTIGAATFDIDLVLIDFGFGCVACGSGFPNPRGTLLGAGNYFRPEDDCLKVGRDLAHFLYSLHCLFPLEELLERDLYAKLHAAMRATRGARTYDLWMGVDAIGNPLVGPRPRIIRFNNGIYHFLRDGCSEVPGCAPRAILSALGAGAV